MPTLASTLVELVQQLKFAISYWKDRDTGVRIEKATLDLKGEFKERLGGDLGGKFFELVPVKLTGTSSNSTIQSISFTLVPSAQQERLADLPDLGEDLKRVLQAIGSAVREAGRGDVPYQLEEGTITLAFGITDDGGITVLGLGASRSTNNVQTVTLKLKGGRQEEDVELEQIDENHLE